MSEEQKHEKATNQEMMVKQEWIPHTKESPNLGKIMKGKTTCHIHNQEIFLKCQCSDCRQPFMCLHPECIEMHFHTPLLQLTKINKIAFEEKFKKVQTSIASRTSLFERAYQIKGVIDSLKSSVGTIFKDMTNMKKMQEDLKGESFTMLNKGFIDKIQQVLALQTKISTTIERIKARMKCSNTDTEDYFMKSEIGTFLQGNVNNYDQNTAKVVYDSKENGFDVSQFHDTLEGKNNLVFLFITEKLVIGSYFSCQYPSISKRRASDPSSFIFVASADPNIKILKYLANSDSSHHIEVSDRFIACQGKVSDGEGICIHSKDPELLQLGLPSESFLAEKITEGSISENLKVNQILVLQGNCDL